MIKRFKQYEYEDLMLSDFIYGLTQESIIDTTKNILGLKLDVPNLEEISKHYHKSIDNLLLNSAIQVEDDISHLATAVSISIIYLESVREKKPKDLLIKEIKSLLEELHLRGVSQIIVKKCVKAIKSMESIIKTIDTKFKGLWKMNKNTPIVISAINYIIDKYDFNLDTITKNFMGLEMGVSSTHTKKGIDDILKKISNNTNLDIDKPKINKISKVGDLDLGNGTEEPNNTQMIKEQ